MKREVIDKAGTIIELDQIDADVLAVMCDKRHADRWLTIDELAARAGINNVRCEEALEYLWTQNCLFVNVMASKMRTKELYERA